MAPNSLKKRPKQDRARATVEAIIEATTRILEADGLEALTTNRVAEVAGVSIGSLYQYFPNKQALIDEVRARFEARFHARLLETVGRLPGLGPREAIREWVATMVTLHAESPGVHNAVGTGARPEEQTALARIVGGYLDVHADAVRRPDRALAGRVLMDAAELMIHHTALREPELLEDPAWVAEVCDLLERYLLHDAPQAAPGTTREGHGAGLGVDAKT